MSIWAEVRQESVRCRARLSQNADLLIAAESLIAAAEADTGIKVLSRLPGDVLLQGAEAAYDREALRIYYSQATDPALANFHIAHEFAHHWLDEAASQCAADDIDIATPGEPEMSWVGDPDTYSPKERAEALANVYAREFLLPRSLLRQHCAMAPFDAQKIADTVNVPVELVMQQMADSLLLPEDADGIEKIEPEKDPDETQRVAIEAPTGPLRVLAGPGTGKTRTLIGRAAHLVKSGTDPHSIAILTFSNLSAQDLAARLRLSLGEKATALWVGTFHAFGLELLRKYGSALGFGEEVRLLDRSGSMNLLLELLPSLELKHFLDLNEPLRRLGSMAGLISRAKDELATPEDYERAAHAQAKLDPDEAEVSLEVSRSYALYDRALRERSWVDFGDLIARSVELLRSQPDIATKIRAQYSHILVDEYQDMNRASGVFLKLLTNPGLGPWVVGDVRQAIYRFRGASPLNLEHFDRDFGGAKQQKLEVNYRSGGKIVRTFEHFGGGTPLKASRGEALGRVELRIANTFAAECEGIATSIKGQVAQGGYYRDHAILSRSHTTLARLAKHLEARGIPCLYFGDFFERPEIRDLLSLLQLVSEPTGVGLVRVAQFPQYQLADADLATVLRCQREQDKPILNVLREAEAVPGLSEAGKEILRRLVADLRDVNFGQKPHTFLMNFLFRDGMHLKPILADVSAAGQQQRLAIFQLLQFCFDFRAAPKTDPKRMFLEQVRRLELLDEEKQLRGLPAAASGIDAVRLMTIHASKGLQFPIVHIPQLTVRHFPFNRKEQYSLPPTLADTSGLMSRAAEEEALFFVALSRGQDELHLSYAVDNGGGPYKKCAPSGFLDRIGPHLPVAPQSAPSWTQAGAPIVEPFEDLPPPAYRSSWPAQAIETYLECPRKFYYSEVLALNPREGRSAFLKTNSAMRSTIEWLQATKSAEERASGLAEQFKSNWALKGPQGHALEALYQRAAEQMIETAASLIRGDTLPIELSLALSGGVTVTARADHMSREGNRIVVQRLKQGRLAKKEETKPRHVVWQAAASQQYPGTDIQFEHVSLLTADRKTSRSDSTKLINEVQKLEQALTDISAGRFHPTPKQYCPSCPFYFICPSHFLISATAG